MQKLADTSKNKDKETRTVFVLQAFDWFLEKTLKFIQVFLQNLIPNSVYSDTFHNHNQEILLFLLPWGDFSSKHGLG